MSFEVQKTAIYEPRLQFGNGMRPWCIVKSAQQSTYTEYPADSSSTSQIVFNCKPPSKQTVLDRVIMVKCKYELIFTGIADAYNAALPLLQGGRDAPRYMPFASTCESLNMKINGYSISASIKDMIHALTRYHSDLDFYNGANSVGPNQQDNSVDYHELDGASRNPLANYGDNNEQCTRGSYKIEVFENTATAARVQFETTEFLFMPPCIWNNDQVPGLVGLDNLQFQFNLTNTGGLDTRLWSRSYANGMNDTGTAYTERLTNITCSLVGKPSILCNWLSVPLTEPIPRLMQYPYFELTRYNNPGNVAALAPGATGTIRSGQISLNSIPGKIYIYACRPDNRYNLYCTNTYLKIKTLRVSWGNQNSVFSGADIHSLYQMGCKNGLKMNYTEFTGESTYLDQVTIINNTGADQAFKISTVGSVICIQPASDLPLESNESEGMLCQKNLQVEIEVVNTAVTSPIASINTANTFIPDLNVITIDSGVLEIFNNSARSYIGVLNAADVVNTPINNSISWNAIQKIYGGSQFERFKNLTNKAIGVARKGNDYLRTTKAISTGLDMLGHPKSADFARSHGYGKGGFLVEPTYGGAKVGKRDLKKRLTKK